MPRLTGHATQGVNQLLKKSMQGRARYRSEMTVTQWRLRPHPGRFCSVHAVMTLAVNLTFTARNVNNL